MWYVNVKPGIAFLHYERNQAGNKANTWRAELKENWREIEQECLSSDNKIVQ